MSMRWSPTSNSDLPLVWGRRCTRCSSAAARRGCSRAEAIDGCCGGARAPPLAPEPKSRSKPTPAPPNTARSSGYRAAGVNRLSLGIQSFDDALPAAPRPHPRRREARARRRSSRRRSFDNFNLDLMYALPGQTLADGRRDVERALALRAAAPVALPADARAEHACSPRPPPLPDDDAAGTCRSVPGALADARVTRNTNVGAMRSRAGSARTTSTTGASATISASAPARTASCRFRTDRAPVRCKQPQRLHGRGARRHADPGRTRSRARATCRSSSC